MHVYARNLQQISTDIMSSDEDGAALMAAFKKNGASKAGAASAKPTTRPAVSSPSTVSGNVSEEEGDIVNVESPPRTRRLAYVRAPPVRNKREYTYYEPQDEILAIEREYSRRGKMLYQVLLSGDTTKEVSENLTITSMSALVK